MTRTRELADQLNAKRHGRGARPEFALRGWPGWAFVAVVVGYVVLSDLGMRLRLPPEQVATFWPAAGLGAAAATFCPRRQWPALAGALYLGCVLGDLRFDPIGAALLYAIANTAESFAFAWLMQTFYVRYRVRRDNTAARVPMMFAVAVVAAALGGLIGAFTTSATYGGAFFSHWRTWTTGDATGVVLAIPIATHLRSAARLSARARSELMVGVVVLVAMTAVMLFGPAESHVAYLPYLVLPPLLWIAVRVGARETAWTASLFGLAVTVATAQGEGPWATGEIVVGDQIFAAQVFLVTVMLTSMAVARSVEDRKHAALRQIEIERALAERDRDIASLAAERARQQLEAQLLQSQRLEALGRLAGGVAHDFNNLLGIIRNYASLLARNDDLPERLRADVDHIEHAAQRGAEFTRELLLFSRGDPEAGGTSDAATVARTVVHMMSRTLGAAVVLRFAATGPTRARIAPARLEQVLVNLVINARDAVVGQGTRARAAEWSNGRIDVVVTGRPAAIEPSGAGTSGGASGEQGAVIIEVIDNGVGMTGEVLARAFEPFFTTKARGEGSGLGLSSVYGIVERAGGRVRIDSVPGAGTTVRLELLAAAPDIDIVEADTPDEGEDEGVVAVVDDDAELLRVTVRLLEGEGIDAVGFGRAEDLVLATERAGVAPSLVVTDVVMAGMSGPELALALWERFPGLPVVFISGFAPAESVDLDDPRAVFVAKPFSTEQLVDAVRARRRAAPPRAATPEIAAQEIAAPEIAAQEIAAQEIAARSVAARSGAAVADARAV